MNKDKITQLTEKTIDVSRRAVEATDFISREEKKLYPKKIYVVAFLLSFGVTYLFSSWVLDSGYLNIDCLFTDDVLEQCTSPEFMENLISGLLITLMLAVVAPFWMLALFAEWSYKEGKIAEQSLIKKTLLAMQKAEPIDQESFDKIYDSISSLHWNADERVRATMNRQ